MDVPAIALKLGILDRAVVDEAKRLVRLCSVKLQGGLGQGEVCKSAVCLELACTSSATQQTPNRDMFIKYGCVTKKVYLNTFSQLQQALGVTPAPPSMAEIAVKFGCEPLAKPAQAFLALYKSRFLQQMPSPSAAAKRPAAAGHNQGSTTELRADFSHPVFAIAAMHLTSSTAGWKKGQAKLDVRKAMKAFDIKTQQFQDTMQSMQDLCAAELGINSPSKSSPCKDSGKEDGADDAQGQTDVQKHRGSRKQPTKKRRKSEWDNLGPAVDGHDGEDYDQEQEQDDHTGSDEDERMGSRAVKANKQRKVGRRKKKSDSDCEEDDADDAWVVVAVAGDTEQTGKRTTRARGAH